MNSSCNDGKYHSSWSNFFSYVYYFSNLPHAYLVTFISCYGAFLPFQCDALCPIAPSNSQACIAVSSFEAQLSGAQLEPTALCFPSVKAEGWKQPCFPPVCINHPWTQAMECNDDFCFFTPFWGHIGRAKTILLHCTLPSILDSQNITLASVFNRSLV